VALIVFFLFHKSDPITFEKKCHDGKTTLKITPHRKIDLLEVCTPQKDGVIKMIRTHLKNNEKVEFSYPFTSAKTKIVIYFGKEIKKYEI